MIQCCIMLWMSGLKRKSDSKESKCIQPCHMLVCLDVRNEVVQEFQPCSMTRLKEYSCQKMLHSILQIQQTVSLTQCDPFGQHHLGFGTVLRLLEQQAGIFQSDDCLQPRVQ